MLEISFLGSPEELERLGTKQRKRLAQSSQCGQFLFLGSLQCALSVAIHQDLNMPIGRRRKPKFTERLNPNGGNWNRCGHVRERRLDLVH